ncbi:hypothetical protein T439DRAFT_380973 [Meredithblackwellia eburnea MCA 4105]
MPRYQQRPTQISSSSMSDLDLELGQHRSRSRSQNRRQFAVDSSSGSDEWGSGSSEGSEVGDSEEDEKRPLPQSGRRSRGRALQVERDLPHPASDGGGRAHSPRRLSTASMLIGSPSNPLVHSHDIPNHLTGEGVNHEHNSLGGPGHAIEMRPLDPHGRQGTDVTARQSSGGQRSRSKRPFYLKPWFWSLCAAIPLTIAVIIWAIKLNQKKSSEGSNGGSTTDGSKYESPYGSYESPY